MLNQHSHQVGFVCSCWGHVDVGQDTVCAQFKRDRAYLLIRVASGFTWPTHYQFEASVGDLTWRDGLVEKFFCYKVAGLSWTTYLQCFNFGLTVSK